MNPRFALMALAVFVIVAPAQGHAQRHVPVDRLDSLQTELLALGYGGDVPAPGSRAKSNSLQMDMVWEGGLKLTAVPPNEGMFFYVMRAYACPDSLVRVKADCLLRDVILVSRPVGDPGTASLTLIARTVVGPRTGPIRPWPTSNKVREDAKTIAGRHRVRAMTAEELAARP